MMRSSWRRPRRRKVKPLKVVPWFARRKAAWGTVYLVHAKNDPSLFKVGFTSRRTIDRRAELNRVAGDDMRIVQTMGMPFAFLLERQVLAKLRSEWFRRSDSRGTEWFRLKRGETISDIGAKIEKHARRLEQQARFRFSWPKDVERRLFKA